MRFCQQHWAALRAAVEARGMSHLVAGSGEEAVERISASVAAGELTASTFDPLMAANFAICTQALEKGGIYLLGEKEGGGHYCPLCELDEHVPPEEGQPASSTRWIEGATDDCRRHAAELGLVGAPS